MVTLSGPATQGSLRRESSESISRREMVARTLSKEVARRPAQHDILMRRQQLERLGQRDREVLRLPHLGHHVHILGRDDIHAGVGEDSNPCRHHLVVII